MVREMAAYRTYAPWVINIFAASRDDFMVPRTVQGKYPPNQGQRQWVSICHSKYLTRYGAPNHLS